MSNPRGVVCKIEFEPVLRTVYLRRNEELLVEVEWEWTSDRNHQFIFPTYEEAEAKVKELRNEGEEHLHVCVVCEAEQRLLQERAQRHRNAVIAAEVSAEPEPPPHQTREKKLKPLQERVAIARRGARTRQQRTHVSQEEYTRRLEREKLF